MGRTHLLRMDVSCEARHDKNFLSNACMGSSSRWKRFRMGSPSDPAWRRISLRVLRCCNAAFSLPSHWSNTMFAPREAAPSGIVRASVMAKTASAFAPRRARVTNVVFIGCSTVGKDSTRLDRRAEVRSAPTPRAWDVGRRAPAQPQMARAYCCRTGQAGRVCFARTVRSAHHGWARMRERLWYRPRGPLVVLGSHL